MCIYSLLHSHSSRTPDSHAPDAGRLSVRCSHFLEVHEKKNKKKNTATCATPLVIGINLSLLLIAARAQRPSGFCRLHGSSRMGFRAWGRKLQLHITAYLLELQSTVWKRRKCEREGLVNTETSQLLFPATRKMKVGSASFCCQSVKRLLGVKDRSDILPVFWFFWIDC